MSRQFERLEERTMFSVTPCQAGCDFAPIFDANQVQTALVSPLGVGINSKDAMVSAIGGQEFEELAPSVPASQHVQTQTSGDPRHVMSSRVSGSLGIHDASDQVFNHWGILGGGGPKTQWVPGTYPDDI